MPDDRDRRPRGCRQRWDRRRNSGTRGLATAASGAWCDGYAVVRRAVDFAAEEFLGGVAGVVSRSAELPPGAAAKANSTPNNQTVANARMASRFNDFFTVLLSSLVDVGLRLVSAGAGKQSEDHLAKRARKMALRAVSIRSLTSWHEPAAAPSAAGGRGGLLVMAREGSAPFAPRPPSSCRHVGIVAQELPGVFPALPDALTSVGEPRAALLQDVVLGGDIDQIALFRNPLAI